MTVPKRIMGGIALAAALVASGCGSASSDKAAETAVDSTDTPATEPDLTEEVDLDESDPDEEDPEDRDPEGDSNALSDIEVQRLLVPFVPVITLPDLSVLSETGTLIEEDLGELVDVGNGLDIVSAMCSSDGAEIVYQGSDDDGNFFDVDVDGSGIFISDGASTDITVTLNPDGSGEYVNASDSTDIVITVNADGSGNYQDDSASRDVSIEVDGNGFGRYHDNSNSSDLVVEISEDGSGLLTNNGTSDSIQVTVNPDGTGLYMNNSGSTNHTIAGNSDGSWSFRDNSPATNIELIVNADGSGSYVNNSTSTNISITVDSDGNGVYADHSAGSNLSAEFETEIGILDPEILIAGPVPVFAVADRFPALASLGQFEPPCVSIIRLDASVLFDFDSDQLRPEADAIIDEVAEVLISTEQSLQVHGHTDSIGSDDYNQDLSERRAQSFTDALTERGVDTEIESLGFGESRPVADNTKADGSDDPAGRQLNRRIEIVVGS